MAIGEVAATVAVTPRHLGTLFQREVGRSPKAIARLFRFERAVRQVRTAVGRGNRVDLAAVAAAAGYADQSYLTRDFVDRLGVAPSRWITEEFRNLQEHGADPATDSGS
jgi:transcriptional regulator GlxA family with amidase domain